MQNPISRRKRAVKQRKPDVTNCLMSKLKRTHRFTIELPYHHKENSPTNIVMISLRLICGGFVWLKGEIVYGKYR